MYKCLIWGSGRVFHNNILAIKYFECIGEICVEGVTSNDLFYKDVAGYRFILKSDLKSENGIYGFDKVIVMADGNAYVDICMEIADLGFADKDIVPYKVMNLVGFDFIKYAALREHVPSIIAPNCWGGITYNTLGLPFNSPIINMFFEPDDYLKMLKNLDYYMEQDLSFVRTQYNKDIDINYPVASCGDILLFFNHYRSFEEAAAKWEERKKRINWDNIFVMFFDEQGNNTEAFSEIPYEKRVYFTERQYKEDKPKWLVTFPHESRRNSSDGFYNVVNRSGKGDIIHYDLFELLLNGKIVLHSTFSNGE